MDMLSKWGLFGGAAATPGTAATLDMTLFVTGAVIFGLTYLAIAFERRLPIDKTAAALFGSSLMLVFVLRKSPGEMSLGAYSRYVRFDVVFLLIGMMVIVHLLSRTGVFQYLAIKCVKAGRGQPPKVLGLLVVVTALSSAFLDNVTTVLLIAPMALLVAEQMKLNPIAFIVPVALASNIGGTATMIGDPPNILIGNYVDGIAFVDFLAVLAPFVLLILGAFVAVLLVVARRRMLVTAEDRARIMDLDESRALTDVPLLRKSLVVMGCTFVGFLLHTWLHLEPGVVAMAGAGVLLVVTRANVEEVFKAVEWPMLFFLVGLFVVVAGAVDVGLIGAIAKGVVPLTGGNRYIALLIVLWGSGLAAGGFNAFGFTTAALPLVRDIALGMGLQGAEAHPFWWALALGACLGGNLTPVGTTANLVVCDIVQRTGRKLTFGSFMRWGAPCAFGALALSTGYVLLIGYLTWG